MTAQRLVGPRQFIQHGLHDALVLRRGDKLALIVDDADHELPSLALLCLDDGRQRFTEFDERDIRCDDAYQLTAGAHRLSNDDPCAEGRFDGDTYLKDRGGGGSGASYDVGGRELRSQPDLTRRPGNAQIT